MTHAPTPPADDQPAPLPDPYHHDGYHWIDALSDGWHVVPYWGADGWNLGSWPLVIVAHYHRDRLWAVATYTEGDITVQTFTSRAGRNAATDTIAAAYWRTFSSGPEDLPDRDEDIPDRYRGPYRIPRTTTDPQV